MSYEPMTPAPLCEHAPHLDLMSTPTRPSVTSRSNMPAELTWQYALAQAHDRYWGQD